MAVADDGTRHVAFIDRSLGRLMYASDDGMGWASQTLAESSHFGEHAIVMGADGPLVVYLSSDGLQLARVQRGRDAVSETLVAGAVRFPNVAFADGRLHVVYSDFDESGAGFGMPAGGLRYGTWSEEGWRSESLNDAWGEGQVVVEGGRIYIAYVEGGRVVLAETAEGAPLETVMTLEDDFYLSAALSVGDDGAVRIAARRGTDEIVVVTRRGPEAQMVVHGVGADLSDELSLSDARLAFTTRDGRLFVESLAPSDAGSTRAEELVPGRQVFGRTSISGAALAFYDWNEGRLIVARHATDCGESLVLPPLPRWAVDRIDPGRDWPSGPRLADIAALTDEAGVAHVAYAFQNGVCCSEIHYATDSSGSWRTMATGGTSSRYGANLALAVADGVPRVGFTSSAGVALAEMRDGRWAAAGVDEAPALGPPAVIIGPTGESELVYGAGRELRHARHTTFGWETTVVDRGTDMHLLANVSADMDAAGARHVAYSDHHGELRYATDESGAWAVEVVDETHGATAIRVQPDGTIRLVYVHYSQLRAATRTDGVWETRFVGFSGTLVRGLSSILRDDGSIVTAHAGWPLGGVTLTELHPDGRLERSLIAVDASDAVVLGDTEPRVVFFDQLSGAIEHAVRR